MEHEEEQALEETGKEENEDSHVPVNEMMEKEGTPPTKKPRLPEEGTPPTKKPSLPASVQEVTEMFVETPPPPTPIEDGVSDKTMEHGTKKVGFRKKKDEPCPSLPFRPCPPPTSPSTPFPPLIPPLLPIPDLVGIILTHDAEEKTGSSRWSPFVQRSRHLRSAE